MFKLVLIFLSLLVSLNSGAAVLRGPPGQTIKFAKKDDYRKTFICLIPDTQNQVRCDIFIGAGGGYTCEGGVGCVGEFCTKSPYCQYNWYDTGNRVSRNQAYALTSQWNKVNWSGIRGNDPIPDKWETAQGPRCDAILSLGDMMGFDDGYAAFFPDYIPGAPDPQQQSADFVRSYWEIIKRSGIPFLPLIGNHDLENIYILLMTQWLNFSSLPFFYKSHSDGRQYAIKFDTPLGRMCAIGGNTSITSNGSARTASEQTWINTEVDSGCGEALPISFVDHTGSHGTVFGWDGVDPLCATPTACSNNDDGYAWLGAYGHWTDRDGLTITLKPAVLAPQPYVPFNYFEIYTNYQQWGRHDITNSAPSGSTCRDGAGGKYTVVSINPRASQVVIFQVDPYWGTTLDPQVPSLFDSHPETKTFDWDARF